VKTPKYLDWIRYGVNTFILRRQSPYLFGLVITDRCNLDCFYCESKNTGGYHFSHPEAVRAVEDAYLRGHRSIYFTGGEPMVWKDDGHGLGELVDRARELGFHDVFVFTNGTIPLEIPRCNYIVTVDGPKAVHDRIRGNTYDLVLENVKNAVTKNVFASLTFSRANAEYLEEYVEGLAATGLFKGISFNFLTHWPEIVREHGVSPEKRIELLDRIWALKKKGYPVVLSRAAYLALRRNDWKRPIPQIELGTRERVFTCCRDVDHPEVCENCGYANCVEVAQILAMKPSALWQVFRMVQ
jgi:MoaA/NifB/PqqE/SkfB family radical SAM enzyme